MLRPRRSNQSLELQTLPLIDVVFLLLTFFLFALALTSRIDLLDITLPKSSTENAPAAQSNSDAVLIVRPDGSLLVDGEPTTQSDLGLALQRAGVLVLDAAADAQITPERGLRIAVDESVRTALLFDVVEQLGKFGVSGLRFVRIPEDSGQAQ